MKPALLTVIALCCLSLPGKSQNTAAPPVTELSLTKIFIVRHADKLPAGDNLSAIGLVRAQELKRVLRLTNIDSVFSTNFNRTKNTVKPFADFRGLPVRLYSTSQEITNHVLTKCRGKRLLIAGHSNTIAEIIRGLGFNPPASINPIPDSQFDNLFIVLIQRILVNGLITSRCELIQMKYGAVTD